jgi:hypothetical protein
MLILLSTLASAVELSAGVLYPGGTELQIPAKGLALTVPKDWTGQFDPTTGLLAFQSSVGLIGLLVGDATKAEDLATALSVPLPLGPGVVLVPSGLPVLHAPRADQQYTVLLAPKKIGFGIALQGPALVGVVVLGAGMATEREALTQTMEAVVSSLQWAPVSAAKTTPIAPQGALATQLAGHRLLYLSTASDTSERLSLDFCSNGQFYAEHELLSGGNIDGMYGSMNDSASGVWKIQGTSLSLSYDNGTVTTAPLSALSAERWSYNGRTWYLRNENTRCQ